MKIQVTPVYKEDEPHIYNDATGWHIDEERQLHVTKDGAGNLGSYATGCWSTVRKVEDNA